MSALQRVMAQWDALHPFNLFVAVTVRAPADPIALQSAIAKSVDGRCAEALAVVRAAADGGDAAGVAAIATSGLNRRFAGDAPAAFTVLAGPTTHVIAMAAPHERLDGITALALLARVVTLYAGATPPAALPATDAGAVSLWRAVRPLVPARRWPRLSAGIARELRAFGRCHRPASGRPEDLASRVVAVPLPDDVQRRARVFAAAHGATANDVFAAALLNAAASVTVEARRSARRGLALALPVDLRALNPALRGRDGVYVSYLNVVIVDEPPDFEALLAAVAAQTRAAMRTRSHVKSLLELRAAATLAAGLGAAERPMWFSRQKPYCAAMTSPRIPRAWLAPAVAEACDGWYGAVSCGPMTPLVAALVRSGRQLTCLFSLRGYGYSAAEADALVATFAATAAAL